MAVAIGFLVIVAVATGIALVQHMFEQRAADARARRAAEQQKQRARANIATARRRVDGLYAQARVQMDETARQWQSGQQYTGDDALDWWQNQ